MATDVTDSTFEQDVIERSTHATVIVDLWAPWCGPCKTLGPILEDVVDETNGAVELVKVNIDENPNVAAAFRVQSIPAVYALKDKQVVDGFIGAVPETAVREFVGKLAPAPSEADKLVAAGDEASLRAALEIDPGHPVAVTTLADMLVERGESDEALALLARIPENQETRRIAAQARLAAEGVVPADDDLDERLTGLLEEVRADDEARQEFLDILESMDPEDPRRASYRKQLTSRLF